MKVVALISGGKDSCYNMMQCVREGHEIVALANLHPPDESVGEMDSYMYQTVGHEAISLFADAMGLPLYRKSITGSAVSQGKDYTQSGEDEVEDLYTLLEQVKGELGVEGVSCGAILSDYQRVRVENVCSRLGLVSLAYLWRRSQAELLDEMIVCKVDAILMKVACLGLVPAKHLGKTLLQMKPTLEKLNAQYGVNVCGEGGEYETFTLDCPLFNSRIVLDESKEVVHTKSDIAPVSYLHFHRLHLEEKPKEFTSKPLLERVLGLSMFSSSHSVTAAQEKMAHMELADACSKLGQRETADTGASKDRFEMVAIPGQNSIHIGSVAAHDCSAHSPGESTAEAMEKLAECLSTHGFTLSDVTYVLIYVRNMDNFSSINSVYKTFFPLNPPVRVCVELPLPVDRLFELHCYAVRGKERRTMHVQSVSHWAPSNIGPYSQGVMHEGGSLFVSGQIPLIPGSMIPYTGGADGDVPNANMVVCQLSLSHALAVVEAHGMTSGEITTTVCYTTKASLVEMAAQVWRMNLVSGTLLCAIVPRLPRDVDVEWQVVVQRCEPVDEGGDNSVCQSSKLSDRKLVICGHNCDLIQTSSDWSSLPLLLLYDRQRISNILDIWTELKKSAEFTHSSVMGKIPTNGLYVLSAGEDALQPSPSSMVILPAPS